MRGQGVFWGIAQGMGMIEVIHGASWVEGKYGANPFMMMRRTDQEGKR